MTGSFDIAVVGGGFAGSLFAMGARRAGRSVVLIERCPFALCAALSGGQTPLPPVWMCSACASESL